MSVPWEISPARRQTAMASENEPINFVHLAQRKTHGAYPRLIGLVFVEPELLSARWHIFRRGRIDEHGIETHRGQS